jgi:hypothetical protein
VPLLAIDSASNVRIQNSKFTSEGGSLTPALVTIADTVNSTKKITFDGAPGYTSGIVRFTDGWEDYGSQGLEKEVQRRWRMAGNKVQWKNSISL